MARCARVEAATGAQLDNVSAHTGPESNAAAAALGARAYTAGSQIDAAGRAHTSITALLAWQQLASSRPVTVQLP